MMATEVAVVVVVVEVVEVVVVVVGGWLVIWWRFDYRGTHSTRRNGRGDHRLTFFGGLQSNWW